MSKDVRAKIGTNDDSKFVRTAIEIAPGKGASIDIVTETGQLMCRINLMQFEQESDNELRGNVDIIIDPKTQTGTFLCWKEGSEQMRHTTSDVSVHAVAINSKNQTK